MEIVPIDSVQQDPANVRKHPERNLASIEISPKYCSVILERWERFTGKKAEKI